jgi:hypothetical protein
MKFILSPIIGAFIAVGIILLGMVLIFPRHQAAPHPTLPQAGHDHR